MEVPEPSSRFSPRFFRRPSHRRHTLLPSIPGRASSFGRATILALARIPEFLVYWSVLAFLIPGAALFALGTGASTLGPSYA